MHYLERRRRVGEDLSRKRLDALIVSAPANVRYLTGFTGSNGLLLLAEDAAILYTDPRYQLQAAQECDCKLSVVRRGPLAVAAVKTAGRRRWKRIGFEKGHITYGAWEMLREELPLGTALEPVAGVVEERRLIKDLGEIALIRQSVEVNSLAFERAVARIADGMTETELAAELDYQMRGLGAEPAFDTIVASGARSALPHARPTPNLLARNRLVLIDAGARRAGYASDMTRMLCVGRPSPKARRLHAAVLEAQVAALSVVRDGIAAEAVDREARRVLRSGGLGRALMHSTGHGLGLEIHERPRLGRGDKTRLREGMTITVEPGAYLEGFGGVRIEDTVLVTATGCEILTRTPKELAII